MIDLPERIWAWNWEGGEQYMTARPECVRPGAVEYVPATALAERDALLAECEATLAGFVDADCAYDGPSVIISANSHAGAIAKVASGRAILARIRSLQGDK